MKAAFTPRRAVLPPAQQKLWPLLAPAAELGFVLYGGTAIALRLGHRTSVDFDFFSSRPLDPRVLATALPFTQTATALQATPDTLTFLAAVPDAALGEVKVSFFGMPGFGRVGQPEWTDDGVLQVASSTDLLATKLKTILQRAEAKDYRDIAALLRAGTDLPAGLGAARALFGPNFQPGEALKALVYFADGDLPALDAEDRNLLTRASSQVGDLPHPPITSTTLD